MRTILYQPVYINPQAYFAFPSLYHIEKGDSYVEPAVYTGQLLIDVVDGSASSVIIKDTKQVDFSDYAGKHIRISQYTDEGAVVLGEWLIPSNQVYLDSHLVDAWFMSGYSNDNPPASISGTRGHELVLKNFAFAGNSGFGKYATNFNSWKAVYGTYTAAKVVCGTVNTDTITWIIRTSNVRMDPLKVRLTNIGSEPIRYYYFQDATTRNFVEFQEDGTYTVPASAYSDIYTGEGYIGFYQKILADKQNPLIIELLPDNAGSLVFDGVDDYAVCDNMPIQTDYTVICRREIINTNNSSAVASKRTYPNDIGSFGAFVIERVTANGSKALYSFGKDNAVDLFNSNQIIYQGKTAYNDRNIIAGDASDTNILSLGANAYNLNLGRCQEFSNVAIYYFALYDKSLTPDEIEQEKIKLNEIWTKRLNR